MKLKLLLATVLLLIAVLMPVEMFARTNFAREHLLPPSYDMNGDIFEVQLHLLDDFVRDEGHVDCIFLGSSIVLQDINPTVLENAYRAQTGEDIECYNFGVTGLVGQAAGLVAPILVERYQPRLLIYGASPREFAARNVTESNVEIIENNWIQYANGNFNWQGFLIDKFVAYRYYLRYQDWLSPDLNEVLTRVISIESRLTHDGHSSVYRTFFDVHIPAVEGNVDRESRVFAMLTDFQPNERDLAGVEAIARLEHETDTRILILEIPTHSSFTGYFNNGAEGYNAFTAAMQDFSNRHEIPYWQIRHLNLIPDEFWRERTHMNGNGALVLSDWLGTQLGLAVPMGLLDEKVPQILLDGVPAPDLPPQDIEVFYDNPHGLSDADLLEYQQFDSYEYIPEGAVILDPDDTPGDLRLYRYNIGANLSELESSQEFYRRLSFELLHLLGRIQQTGDFPADVQIAIQTWRDTGDATALKQAGIDYLMIPSAWLMFEDDTLINTAQLEFIQTWEYRGVGVVYRQYRIR